MPSSDPNPHFFKRDDDGSVRLRLRFTKEEADIIEAGAGATPLVQYIHRVLLDRARYHARRAHESHQQRLRESAGETK